MLRMLGMLGMFRVVGLTRDGSRRNTRGDAGGDARRNTRGNTGRKRSGKTRRNDRRNTGGNISRKSRRSDGSGRKDGSRQSVFVVLGLLGLLGLFGLLFLLLLLFLLGSLANGLQVVNLLLLVTSRSSSVMVGDIMAGNVGKVVVATLVRQMGQVEEVGNLSQVVLAILGDISEVDLISNVSEVDLVSDISEVELVNDVSEVELVLTVVLTMVTGLVKFARNLGDILITSISNVVLLERSSGSKSSEREG
jgi:hypothetical protein